MRAHLVQFDIAWEDRDANNERVRGLLASTDISPGDLILLPEMFDSGFSLNVERTSDAKNLTLDALASLAQDLQSFVQGGRTILESGEALATNCAPVIAPSGELLCEYAKVHPFSFGREGERFRGGREVVLWNRHLVDEALTHEGGSDRATKQEDLGPPSPSSRLPVTPSLRLAPSICYDLRFPELFRIQALRGAECFCLGANWPDTRQHHWRALAIARAIENQAYMLAVNRTGSDPHLRYVGGSIAIDPRGDVLAELDEREGVLSVEIDPSRVRRWREAFRALDDIRLIGDGASV